MTGYRYELFIDNESQGVGIFQGMEDNETGKIINHLFQDLPIPPHSVFRNNPEALSFFTKEGKNKFSNQIEQTCQLYEKEGLFCVKEKQSKIPDNRIIYMDEYQIIANCENTCHI